MHAVHAQEAMAPHSAIGKCLLLVSIAGLPTLKHDAARLHRSECGMFNIHGLY